jgi:hypothetical protein
MRHRLCHLILVLTLALPPASAVAQTDRYLSDMPRDYPSVYDAWTRHLPYAAKMPTWIAQFQGVSTPLRNLTIGTRNFKFGTICVPHDCAGNMMGVAFAPGSNWIIAMATLSSKTGPHTTMTFGDPTNAELSCIIKATSDSSIKTC